ncbi:MAG: hypothetical protein GXX90_01760, partial [Microbacteriaceae bacterium]|nr:hypothetical protein [Microbacteriaceae bacterium]
PAGAERAFAAMLEMFTPEQARRGVIAVGADWGRRVLESTRIPVATVSTDPAVEADWLALPERDRDGLAVVVAGRDGRSVRTRVRLDGAGAALDEREFDEYGALDLGLALVLLEEAGWELEQVQEALDRVGGLDLREHREHDDHDGGDDAPVEREAGW